MSLKRHETSQPQVARFSLSHHRPTRSLASRRSRYGRRQTVAMTTRNGQNSSLFGREAGEPPSLRQGFSVRRVEVGGGGRLRPPLTPFEAASATFRRRGDTSALTGRPSGQREVNLDRRRTALLLPLLSLPHWRQPSTISSNHTHRHTHTYPSHFLSHTHTPPSVRAETTPPPAQRPSLLSAHSAFNLIHPSAKSKAPQLNLSN